MPSWMKALTHVLEDIAHAARAAVPDRAVHLILENEENQASRLSRDRHGEPIQFTAQWNDDVHHVLHTAASGERSGYYADYVEDTEKLGRALAEGFAFQGEMMPYRGQPRGGRAQRSPPLVLCPLFKTMIRSEIAHSATE